MEQNKNTKSVRRPWWLTLICNAIYWGLGTPVVLALGVCVYGITRVIMGGVAAIFASNWGSLAGGLIIIFTGTLLFILAVISWTWAGIELGHLEDDRP